MTKTMTTGKLAVAVGTLGFVLALAWQASAESLYFDQYIAPALKAHEHAWLDYERAPLFDASPTAPLYPAPADRTVWVHQGLGLALVAGDVAPAAPTTPWDDRQRPELFRIAFAR